MSRVGKKPIPVPQGVQVTIKDQRVTVKGPKGELHEDILPEIGIEQQDNELTLIPRGNDKKIHALHGLYRTLVANMVHGVTEGFQKNLKIVGIGYRANVSGKALNLTLGYSHPIKYAIPDNISIEVTKDNQIIIKGIDKQRVGQIAAEIRDFKRPEPYKGKGIMYRDERIRTKVGKTGA
ncbi:MAG: 50S ribosomal protein L6 [bacterium]